MLLPEYVIRSVDQKAIFSSPLQMSFHVPSPITCCSPDPANAFRGQIPSCPFFMQNIDGSHISTIRVSSSETLEYDIAGDATTFPPSPQDQMLQPPYDIGARISTNSWGAVRTTYTSLDRQMDHFAYSNTDMVIVIAAGNCGDIVSGCTFLVRTGDYAICSLRERAFLQALSSSAFNL